MDRPLEGGDAPQIQTAEDLLLRMRAGTKEVHEIHMRDLTIPVRVLSIDEVNNIRRSSIVETQKKAGDDTDKNLTVQKLTLKLASTLVKNGAPLLSDKLLSLLSVDEVNYLYEEYIKVMDSVNPSIETIDPEVFRNLVDALKKNNVTWKDLSLRQLRGICTAFVDLIQRLENQASLKASSSGGQQ